MRHNTRQNPVQLCKWKFLIQEYELVKQKRHPTFLADTDFIRPTGRPSSSITTGSARAEPSTPWCLSHAARSGKVGGSTGILSNNSGGWASTGMRFARSWLRSSST